MLKILILSACSALLFTGCFESTTLITVRKDGAGQILQRTFISQQAEGLMAVAAMAQGQNGAANMPNINLTSNEFIQAAANMGEGVTFVKARKLKKESGEEGSEAMFAFKDINKLKVSLTPDTTAGAVPSAKEVSPFQFTKGVNPTLSITIPHDKIRRPNNSKTANDPTAKAMMQQMMKPLLAGMKISIFVEVSGQLTDSDATYISASPNSRFKNRITMADVNMDNILAHPAGMDLLEQLSDENKYKEAWQKLAKDISGIKIENKDKVFLTFR